MYIVLGTIIIWAQSSTHFIAENGNRLPPFLIVYNVMPYLPCITNYKNWCVQFFYSYYVQLKLVNQETLFGLFVLINFFYGNFSVIFFRN